MSYFGLTTIFFAIKSLILQHTFLLAYQHLSQEDLDVDRLSDRDDLNDKNWIAQNPAALIPE